MQNHANSYLAFYMELFVSNNSEPINVILPGNQITTSTINIQISLFMKEENKREETLKKLDPNENNKKIQLSSNFAFIKIEKPDFSN